MSSGNRFKMIEVRDNEESSTLLNAIYYLKRFSRIVNSLKFLGTILGAALISISEWLSDVNGDKSEPFLDVVFWTGIVLVVSGSTLLIFFDQNTPDVIEESIRNSRRVAVANSNIDYLLDFQKHLLARISLSSFAREIIETAVLDKRIDEVSLARYANAIIEFMAQRKNSLFGISDEYWNFSVYKFDKEKERLVCIACKREDHSDEVSTHREWRSGEGHVGLTFLRSNEIIFSDATKEELQAVIGARDENRRSYDFQRYRSLASIPISTDGVNPLGVLIATSDVVGRFKNESEMEERDWEREDALREAAAFLAILFKLAHSPTAVGDPS